MYQNFGDENFFEQGVLIFAPETSLGVFDMILCRPCSDNENHYRFATLFFNIDAEWIDRDAVMEFADMMEFNPVAFAIACTEMYPWEKFAAESPIHCHVWQNMTREEILDILKDEPISYIGLDPFFERLCPSCGRPLVVCEELCNRDENIWICEECDGRLSESDIDISTFSRFQDVPVTNVRRCRKAPHEASVSYELELDKISGDDSIEVVTRVKLPGDDDMGMSSLWDCFYRACPVGKALEEKYNLPKIEADAARGLKSAGLVIKRNKRR